VEAVFERLDEWGPQDLVRIAPGPRDADALVAGRREVERVARLYGRGQLVDEARDAIREALAARATGELVGVMGTRVVSGGRPEDLAGLIAALGDTVAVAVVEDVLAPDVAIALAEPGRAILGLPPIRQSPAAPGPGARTDSPAIRRWEPSDQDWSAADGDRWAPGEDNLLPGVRGLWVAFVALFGVGGVVGAVVWGLATDAPWLGALGAVAIVAVAWTLATYRPAR
jgi:hypothetical protein